MARKTANDVEKDVVKDLCEKHSARIASEKSRLAQSGLCRVAYENFSAKECHRQISPTTILHHILPLEYFLQTFAKGILRFTCINVWKRKKDSWEGFLFKACLQSFITTAYAMSWTDADETKAMWKRYGKYSDNGIGVRISMTAQDIACAMCEFWRKNGYDLDSAATNDIRKDKVSIAPVEYMKTCELKKCLKLIESDQGQQEVAADDKRYFHLKRMDLMREHEIRVYTQVLEGQWKNIEKGSVPGEFLGIGFDPNCIKSISVCPYAEAGEIARAITRLSEHGFTTDIVKMGKADGQ